MIVVLMGVAGAGKTAVGRALAAALAGSFADADDFHSAEAVAKMQRGDPLTDADRDPWLDRLATFIEEAARDGRTTFLACSALKERYRARLRAAGVAGGAGSGNVRFVFLRVTAEVAARRVGARPGHYMPASLVQSQFEALEEPRGAITVDADAPLATVVAAIRQSLAADAERIEA